MWTWGQAAPLQVVMCLCLVEIALSLTVASKSFSVLSLAAQELLSTEESNA